MTGIKGGTVNLCIVAPKMAQKIPFCTYTAQKGGGEVSEQFCTGTIVISSENAPISISDLNRFLGHFFPLEGGNWGGNWELLWLLYPIISFCSI